MKDFMTSGGILALSGIHFHATVLTINIRFLN